jgi:hypothetical protein
MRNATLAITIVALACLARPAAAQHRPEAAIEGAFGALLFPDDGGAVEEGFLGGTARFYVLPRLGIGPEVVYVQGGSHSHLMLTGNVTWDVLGPVNGRPRRVTPFVLAGGGLFQTRQSFFREDFTSSDGAFTAGGGVRAAVGRRAYIGAEARLGWELHLRLNAIVGVRLGG